MTQPHIFDDLGALRRDGVRRKKPRKPKAARKAKDGPYVQMTAEEAMDGFQALGCHAALVWYELLYLDGKRRAGRRRCPIESWLKWACPNGRSGEH